MQQSGSRFRRPACETVRRIVAPRTTRAQNGHVRMPHSVCNIVCGESFHQSHDQPPSMPLFGVERAQGDCSLDAGLAMHVGRLEIRTESPVISTSTTSTNTQAGLGTFHRHMCIMMNCDRSRGGLAGFLLPLLRHGGRRP
jgi:hypothetical protein